MHLVTIMTPHLSEFSECSRTQSHTVTRRRVTVRHHNPSLAAKRLPLERSDFPYSEESENASS